jgi:hypothetical protein
MYVFSKDCRMYVYECSWVMMFDCMFCLDAPICMCSPKIAECMYMSVVGLYVVHMDIY